MGTPCSQLSCSLPGTFVSRHALCYIKLGHYDNELLDQLTTLYSMYVVNAFSSAELDAPRRLYKCISTLES